LWVPLKDVKQSNPSELADYAVANGLMEQPAFNWWVHDILKKCNRIINRIKSEYWSTNLALKYQSQWSMPYRLIEIWGPIIGAEP